MAKGRRLTTSRSDRYLGTYAGEHSHSHSHSHAVPLDGSEFCEEDVWSTIGGDDGGEVDESGAQYNYYGNGHAPGGQWESRVSDAQRIPRRDRHAGGFSLAVEGSGRTTSSRIVHQFRAQDAVVLGGSQTRRQHHMATSAPMNVPDWSKILRVDSAESMIDTEDVFFEDEPDSAVDPPHEYLARSRKTAATSVFEGVGRTLKGRDMSRLRDEVWSQTGFDG